MILFLKRIGMERNQKCSNSNNEQPFLDGGLSEPKGTYGLTFLGSWKPWASDWGLIGGGWGRRAGSAGCWAPCAGDWITPFSPPSTPFMFSWGLPVMDAMSPPTTGRVVLPDWLMLARLSVAPLLKPFSSGWPREAGLGWGGGVPWKESEELLRDGLPEWSSWINKTKETF